MKIKREALVAHLQRIACGGQVTEAVFSEAFATTAMTPDHLLMVSAPSLPKTKGLTKKGETVGLADLSLLMRSLNVLAGAGNEAVEVEVRLEDHRLIIDEDHRGVLELMTAQPKTIGTRVEDEVAEGLMAKAPKAKQGIALTRALVEGIRNTFSLFKATEVELTVGPTGGRVQVGNDNSHKSKFASAELKAAEEYALLFGSHFVDVLGVVTNYSEAMMYLGGPDAIILIDDGGYKYVLSPRSKSADA